MALQPIDCDEVTTPKVNVLSHQMRLPVLRPMDYVRFQYDKALHTKEIKMESGVNIFTS